MLVVLVMMVLLGERWCWWRWCGDGGFGVLTTTISPFLLPPPHACSAPSLVSPAAPLWHAPCAGAPFSTKSTPFLAPQRYSSPYLPPQPPTPLLSPPGLPRSATLAPTS